MFVLVYDVTYVEVQFKSSVRKKLFRKIKESFHFEIPALHPYSPAISKIVELVITWTVKTK